MASHALGQTRPPIRLFTLPLDQPMKERASLHTTAALLLLVLFGSSCNVLANRGRDFLDQYQFAVGVTSGGGVRLNAGGVVHTGLNIGIKPDGTSFGWKYGRPKTFYTPTADVTFDADQALLFKTTTVSGLNYAQGSYRFGRESFFLLPALFSKVDAAPREQIRWYVPAEGVGLQGHYWIWSRDAFENARAAQIHAFDFELEIGLVGYFTLGYSPGESLDFLLGFFGIDLAQDDGR